VDGLVAAEILLKLSVAEGADCKWNPALIQQLKIQAWVRKARCPRF